MYKISFILPVYNVQDYLEQCIQSILDIESLSYEIIVINDGSTDNSLSIINRLLEGLQNVTIINQKNSGLSVARNIGIENASGEYICFVDSDDKISASIGEILEQINGDEDIVVGDFYKWDGEDGVSLENIASCKISGTGEFFLKKYYLKKIYTVVWRNIYRNKYIKDNNLFFYPGIYFEDVEWSCRSLYGANKVLYVNIPFYFYRKRLGSIINTSFSVKKFDSIISVTNSLLEFTQNMDDLSAVSVIHESAAYFLLLAMTHMNKSHIRQDNIQIAFKLLYSLYLTGIKYKILILISKLSHTLFFFILRKKFKV